MQIAFAGLAGVDSSKISQVDWKSRYAVSGSHAFASAFLNLILSVRTFEMQSGLHPPRLGP